MKKQKSQLQPRMPSRLADLTKADLKRAAGGNNFINFTPDNNFINLSNFINF
jgi:hypothetical protein